MSNPDICEKCGEVATHGCNWIEGSVVYSLALCTACYNNKDLHVTI